VIADHPQAAPYRHVRNDPATTISIGRNSWIGERAVLHGGAQLGEGAIVGAFAVVDFQVPDFAIVAGNPARIVGSSENRSVTRDTR
jgi:acetyltransferase-like isoleucine patch superfamily enzyme